VRKACLRTLDLLIFLYDLGCPTEQHRQKMRRGFRELVREFPFINEMYSGVRQRLGEHEGWVEQGMDEPDPDEIEGGGHA
jgi:hypothetical protein